MADLYIKAAVIYLTAISVMAVILTVVDKNRAKKHKWRIPERTLMFVGFLGGAFAEYITMKLTHHKTLHKKFMVGLPVFFIIHIILFSLFLFI